MTMFPEDERHQLMDERRKRHQHWSLIIERASLIKGDVWVDLGCGNGYLSLPLSQSNRVIALDGQRGMLDGLMGQASQKQRSNLDPILARLPSIPLQDGMADRMMMVNVFHEIEDRSLMVDEILRVLKFGGSMTLVDFRPDGDPDIGPPMKERISMQEVISAFGGMTPIATWIEPDYYQIELLKPLPEAVSKNP